MKIIMDNYYSTTFTGGNWRVAHIFRFRDDHD
jgi:hypothetical protein